jgi:hypothetical protein
MEFEVLMSRLEWSDQTAWLIVEQSRNGTAAGRNASIGLEARRDGTGLKQGRDKGRTQKFPI